MHLRSAPASGIHRLTPAALASRPATSVVLLACAVSLLVWLAACGGGRGGGESPELVDLSGRPVSPLDRIDGKAAVFVFVHSMCPISNRYAPEVRRLHERFGPQGIRFWLVYPDPKDTPEVIRDHMEEYSYPMGALRDPRHALVREAGVKITPEVAVYLPDGERIYRGRIDDLYAGLGRPRREPTRRDLQEVLEGVASGHPPEPHTTDGVGCFIADLQ